MTIENLKIIVEKLIALGEDAEELQYWLDIYIDLPEEQQKEIFENLSAELKKLEALS